MQAVVHSMAEAKQEIAKTAEKLAGKDLVRNLLEASSPVIKDDISKNFYQQSTPSGQPWPLMKHPAPDGRTRLLNKSGGLLRSLVNTSAQGHIEKIEDETLTIGSSLPYANIHDKGGVIRPRKAKYLCIPLTIKADRAGSPRNFGGELFVLCRRGRQPIGLAEKGTGLLQYLFSKMVVIPARAMVGFGKRLDESLNKAWLKVIGQKFMES